ncbi:MAG: tripartite tricarboxylate transporter substrate binding protein, partial [Burkholderiales bacterium]|nr:tripartite tricarboxylate transporter substrate binding protein [Burkholderiales bacterium]
MRVKTVIAAALLACSPLGYAQDYTSRTITFVVPAPPGGATDSIARALAEEMGKHLGQVIIVDNRPGAAGMLGTQAVARANPDGYTVLVAHSGPIAYAPYMFAKVPYNVQLL